MKFKNNLVDILVSILISCFIAIPINYWALVSFTQYALAKTTIPPENLTNTNIFVLITLYFTFRSFKHIETIEDGKATITTIKNTATILFSLGVGWLMIFIGIKFC